MLSAIKLKLISLYQNAQEELGKTPIQSSAALAALIVILLPLATNLLPSDTSSNRIIKILSTNTELNLLLLGLTVSLLVWSLITLRQSINQSVQEKFTFLDYAGVSWKINNPDSPLLEVDFPSYCIHHRVQHFWASNQYLCPVCSDKHMPYILNKNLGNTHKAAENLAKAKRDKHVQVQRNK